MHDILIIDHNPKTVDSLRHVIESHGFGVRACHDGASAIQILRQDASRVHAVFLTDQLQDMQTVDFIRQLGVEGVLYRTPLIIVSASSGDERIAEFVLVGASMYLQEPYEKNMILAALKSALRQRRVLDETREDTRELMQALPLLKSGCFGFKTVAEAQSVATHLSRACPDPERVFVGLSEIMVNAVEHGNLSISYDEKSELLEQGRWDDEMSKRLNLEPFKNLVATVCFEKHDDFIRFVVEDQGKGFEWQSYEDFDLSRVRHPHGRGIALARHMSFDSMQYQGKGNVVEAVVSLKNSGGCGPAKNTGGD